MMDMKTELSWLMLDLEGADFVGSLSCRACGLKDTYVGL